MDSYDVGCALTRTPITEYEAVTLIVFGADPQTHSTAGVAQRLLELVNGTAASLGDLQIIQGHYADHGQVDGRDVLTGQALVWSPPADPEAQYSYLRTDDVRAFTQGYDWRDLKLESVAEQLLAFAEHCEDTGVNLYLRRGGPCVQFANLDTLRLCRLRERLTQATIQRLEGELGGLSGERETLRHALVPGGG